MTNRRTAPTDGAADPPIARSERPMERRSYELVELRVAGEGQAPKIEGHAAVFNQPSEQLSDWFDSFRELIAPGAFTKTIQEADVRALFNHDPSYVLGRNKAGTLSLREDAVGLAFEAEPPDVQWARDLMVSMERGDISQCSFGFQVVKDRWDYNRDTKETTRTLLEVRLFDVSVVTYPAYPQTDAAVRSALGAVGIDATAVAGAITRARAGKPLTSDDYSLIESSAEVLRSYLHAEPAADQLLADHSANDGASRSLDHSLPTLRRRLELTARA